jgi:hypothetical protein
MPDQRMSRPVLSAAVLAVALATTVAAQPSADLHDYVLFAGTLIKMKEANVLNGDVGVNAFEGRLIAAHTFSAPGSVVAADEVRFDKEPANSVMQQLYANVVDLGPQGTPFATPIVADLAAGCDFPSPFPGCDELSPVGIDPGITVTLHPGTYGTLRMRGTPAAAGIVELTGGNYVFCDVKLSRNAEIRALAPSTIQVVDKASFGPNTVFGPAAGSGLGASDVPLFVAGALVKFSRGSFSQANVCAPGGKLKFAADGTHVGMHVADSIKAQPATLSLTPD